MLQKCKMATKYPLYISCGRKNLKLKKKKKNYNHILQFIFQDFTEIQNGRHTATVRLFTHPSPFFVAQKTRGQNKNHILDHVQVSFQNCCHNSTSDFTITFQTIWICAGNFFMILLKFTMPATDRLHNCVWAQKLFFF